MGEDGDMSIVQVPAAQGGGTDSVLYTKVAGAWAPQHSLQGPMGPAITVQGPLPEDTDLTTFTLPGGVAPQAGDAFILELVTGTVDASIPTYTPPATAANPNPVPRHEHGDFIFFDGTNWHNGGNIQGPIGPQGPPATVAAHITDAATQPTDPATSTGTGARPCSCVGDLIVNINGVPQNLGSLTGPIGPQGAVGPAGPQGDQGDSITGVFISDGATTINGQTYPQGHLVIETTIPNSPQPFYTDVGPVVGAAGAPGAAGATGAQGVAGRTPVVTTGATDPTAASNPGLTGDLYINNVSGDLFISDGTNWNKGPNLRGPMGPALSIQGNIAPNDPAPTCGGPGDAGHAWVLHEPGTAVGTAATVPPGGWLAGITPPTRGGTAEHRVGDIIFCDGTTLHNGGEIEGPAGPQGQTGPMPIIQVGDGTAGTAGTIYTAPAGTAPLTTAVARCW